KWIISKLHKLIKDVDENMLAYDLPNATKPMMDFIDELSNWYIRRSRKRFWKSEDDGDKNDAYQTLHYVLVELAKVMAPFTPFISEDIYKNLTGGESVHLVDFPAADESLIDESLNEKMESTRNIITEALQLRAKNSIKVRQSLSELIITNYEMQEDFMEIMKEEVNVKNVIIKIGSEKKVELNTEITPELKLEGQAREIIRFIQEMRKEAGYEVDNRIEARYTGLQEVFAEFGSLIQKEVLANSLDQGDLEKSDLEKEFKIEEAPLLLKIRKSD
ncbi:MAG: isoleucine--tRNA ligase, partial [Candidatus Moranbacteria bacterium CG23_combo_of_CG06-09_8_20_14_all_39_10]